MNSKVTCSNEKIMNSDANKESASNESNEIKLSAEQKAKIENNRQRALLLREKKKKNLTTNEYVQTDLNIKLKNFSFLITFLINLYQMRLFRTF